MSSKCNHKSHWEAIFSHDAVSIHITLGFLTLRLPCPWGVRLPKASTSKALQPVSNTVEAKVFTTNTESLRVLALSSHGHIIHTLPSSLAPCEMLRRKPITPLSPGILCSIISTLAIIFMWPGCQRIPQTYWLNQQTFSPSSGGWKPKIKVSVGWVSPEASLSLTCRGRLCSGMVFSL